MADLVTPMAELATLVANRRFHNEPRKQLARQPLAFAFAPATSLSLDLQEPLGSFSIGYGRLADLCFFSDA
jgi:hypothetical protein